jgi:plasmid maintenance system killer protein
MTQHYRDKRTREFAEGKRVPEFEGIRRRSEQRLDIPEAATSLADLQALPAHALEGLNGYQRGQYVIRITCSGGSAASRPNDKAALER